MQITSLNHLQVTSLIYPNGNLGFVELTQNLDLAEPGPLLCSHV